MTAPDTDTLAGLLARLRGQDPIPSRSEVADAIEALAAKDKARIERLEAALREAAMDCETAIKVEYGWPNVHPAMQPKFDRDMSEIAGWRAALEDGE